MAGGALEGVVIGMGFTIGNRHAQYITMDGVHRGWIRSGASVPQYVLRQIPGRGSGGRRSQKLKQNVVLEYNF